MSIVIITLAIFFANKVGLKKLLLTLMLNIGITILNLFLDLFLDVC